MSAGPTVTEVPPRRWAHRRRLAGPAPSRLLGLRSRLVVAFVLVSLVSGAAVAGASYRQARNVLLDKTQVEFAKRTRDNVNRFAAQMRLPPDQAELEQLGDAVSGLAVYGNARSSFSQPAVPDELRRAVHGRDEMVMQRVQSNGQAYVIVGIALRDPTGRPTGVEVYAVQDLVRDSYSIDQLARSAAVILAGAALGAILLALGAASGVLRPVRDLRRGVQQLAEGQLHTRLRDRGSDELAHLVHTFNTMAATLQRNVSELRGMKANAQRFVADVSHELRTPLTAMTAVTDVLDDEAAALDGDAAIAARMVSTETRKLRQLVDNLIEISRFDNGGAALRLEEVSLASVVQATLEARGWAGEVKVDLDGDLIAEMDRRRVDVIVANMVGNALKHGSPPVTVHLAGAGPETVIVTVTDSGPGLAPEILPHVFERFYKADSARARSDGSGLGLAIAWENARLHGGTLEAGNAPGGGGRFTLRLPRRTTVTGGEP